ncbi:hypothetical protein [Longispora albida]|uniref:hypothetical protein n=1 Tax=Longispora albida TaxID=203523 RepID=UPI000362D302|nr:hypothetical protein [Longispora albida]
MADTPAARLRLALDMFEVGEEMVRARLKRTKPAISEEEVTAEVQAWLLSKPLPLMGGFGRPSNRFA